MKMRNLAIGVIVFATVTAWNSRILKDWMDGNGLNTSAAWNDPFNSGNLVKPMDPELAIIDWQAIRNTVVTESDDGGFSLEFDKLVSAAEGKRVGLRGVGFVLRSGLSRNENGEDEVKEFLLLPGDGGVAWCCGLSAIPRAEFSVLVECPNASFPESKANPKSSSFFVQAEGILRLSKKTRYNAFYTLEDADVEFIDIRAVLPPGVMNPCLNQPMITREPSIRNN